MTKFSFTRKRKIKAVRDYDTVKSDHVGIYDEIFDKS